MSTPKKSKSPKKKKTSTKKRSSKTTNVDDLNFELINLHESRIHPQLSIGDIEFTLVAFESDRATRRLKLEVLTGPYKIVHALMDESGDYIKLKIRHPNLLFSTHRTDLMNAPARMDGSHKKRCNSWLSLSLTRIKRTRMKVQLFPGRRLNFLSRAKKTWCTK